MSRPTKLSVVVVLVASVALGACSTPDPNAPPKFSGDPGKAIPTLETTTTVPGTQAPPSTRYYSQSGDVTTTIASPSTTAAA